MSKRLFIAMLAAAALMIAGCDGVDDPANNTSDGPATNADLVGKWAWNEDTSIEFKANGTYSELMWGTSTSGSWSLDKGVISFRQPDGGEWEATAVLTGGKAWLALIQEDEERGFRSINNYLKEGATVQSGKLSNGRWDAPFNGVKPAQYTADVDYGLILLIDGNKITMYIPAWGYRIEGTYTLKDGKLHIETDDDHISRGYYLSDNSLSWQASGRIDDETDTEMNFNPETFELRPPYEWYSVNDLLAMGKKPSQTDPEYQANPYLFKFLVYEEGESVRKAGLDQCNMKFCVAANGREAYGGMGVSGWLYKR